MAETVRFERRQGGLPGYRAMARRDGKPVEIGILSRYHGTWWFVQGARSQAAPELRAIADELERLEETNG